MKFFEHKVALEESGQIPLVAVVMGSDSDLSALEPGIKILEEFNIKIEVRVLSAHRTPLEMIDFAKEAESKGIKVIIAGAGGAAHLPGMVASLTCLPVIGVPIKSKSLSGLDSMYSILQMPSGVPVATVAIQGGLNAGLLAMQILGTFMPEIQEKVIAYKQNLRMEVRTKDKLIKEIGSTTYLQKMNE